MSTTLSSPVTGGAQADLTSPTYTIAADISPSGALGRQYAVTALGGTQTGVNVHTPSSPFTINIVRPAQFKTLGQSSVSTGIPSSFPRNNWKVIVRKSMAVSAVSFIPQQIAVCTLDIAIPAGAEGNAKAEIEAMVSLLIGSLNQFSSSFGQSLVTGIA